jgi:ferritin-like metal-binding protein YciE
MNVLVPNLDDLYALVIYKTYKLYDGEMKLYQALPQWIDWVETPALKEALKKYTDQTLVQLERLRDCFAAIDENDQLEPVNDVVMEYYIKTANAQLVACNDQFLKEACLIGCIQEINHYKITVYGTSGAFAKTLELDFSAELFHDAEISEREIDERLSHIAEYKINNKAR